MAQNNVQQELQNQFTDVVSRLKSKQLFQSDWDIASFAIFFIFIGKPQKTLYIQLYSLYNHQKCNDETGSHQDRPRKGKAMVTSVAQDKFIIVTSLRKKQVKSIQNKST
uniref:Uncharacterized protein n=1 Tax=Astyanax mexicanus TaxID=7994 RepID=A0A8B9H7E5_ASTMX